MPSKKKIVPSKAKTTKRRKTVIPREPVAKNPPPIMASVAASASPAKKKIKPKPVFVAVSAPAVAAVIEAAVVPLPPPPVEITFEMVARRAYEIWEAKIRLANDSVQNWLEAEQQLRK